MQNSQMGVRFGTLSEHFIYLFIYLFIGYIITVKKTLLFLMALLNYIQLTKILNY